MADITTVEPTPGDAPRFPGSEKGPECEEAIRAGNLRLDGVLQDAAAAALEVHLRGCDSCRDELHRIERSVGAMRSSSLAGGWDSSANLPADLRSRILARVEAAPAVLRVPLRGLLLRAAAGLLIAVSAGLLVFMVEGAPQSVASETLHLPVDRVQVLLGCFANPDEARQVLVHADVRRAELRDQLRTCEGRVYEHLATGNEGATQDELSVTMAAVDLLQFIGPSLDRDGVRDNPGIWPISDSEWQQLWDALCCWVDADGARGELPRKTCEALRELPLRADVEDAERMLNEVLSH